MFFLNRVLLLVVLFALLGSIPLRAADLEQAQYNAAVALYNAGQWPAAVTKIDERLKVNSAAAWQSKYLFAKGLCYEKGDRSSEARSVYRDLSERFPSSAEAPGARLALLYLDYAAGDWTVVRKSLSTLDRRALAGDDRRNVAVIAGEAAYQAGEVTNAWSAFTEALAAGADRNALATKMFDCAVRMRRPADILTWSTQPVAGVSSDKLAMIRADACVVLGRWAEAQQAIVGIQPGQEAFPRAEFIRAQYLIQAGQLSNALAHLETAVRDLRDPSLPPSVWLALAECRMAAGEADKALQAIEEAERRAGASSTAEQETLKKQFVSTRLRMIGQSGDSRKIIKAITESRQNLPPDQASAMLYLRLYSLEQESKIEGILDTMNADYPILKVGADDGPATWIYFKALKARGRNEEGLKLLDEFIKRKPVSPEALPARIELARAALDRKDWVRTRELITTILASSSLKNLAPDQIRDLRYNLAVAAYNSGLDDDVLRVLQAWDSNASNDAQKVQLQLLAGQSAFRKKDYAQAVKVWQAALASGLAPQPGRLHEQVAMAALAQKDATTALLHFEKAVASGATLTREAEEGWARSLYQMGRFSEAGDRLSHLAERFKEVPDYAFEAAVALEKARRFKEAESFYQVAGRQKDKLATLYSNEVDRTLAQLRYTQGLGDRGLDYWMTGLAVGSSEVVFSSALQSLGVLQTDERLQGKIRILLAKVQDTYSPTQSRYYLIGAHRLLNPASPADRDQLAGALVARFIQNEKGLDAQSAGATLAPAILFYFRGEAARHRQDFGSALADYETVLSAYPCNEWPDAAAYGAAECFAGLGDVPTALARLEEIAGQATNTVSGPWVLKARQRLNELKQKKGTP
jgi:tetratricopeptide (TPR) repeat protein